MAFDFFKSKEEKKQEVLNQIKMLEPKLPGLKKKLDVYSMSKKQLLKDLDVTESFLNIATKNYKKANIKTSSTNSYTINKLKSQKNHSPARL